MRETWTKWVGTAVMGLAVMLAQGCRQQAKEAPAQGVGGAGSATPRAVPGQQAVPAQNEVQGAAPVAGRPVLRRGRGRRRTVVRPTVPVQSQPVDAQAEAARRKLQDQTLLQQQAAAAQKAQRENDRQVRENVEVQKKMQEEPRIQDPPAAPESGAVPGDASRQDAPRIQDAPGSGEPPAQPQLPQ